MNRYFLAIASLTVVSTASLLPSAAQAHHRSGHQGGPPHRVQQTYEEGRRYTEESNSYEDVALTTAQRTALISLFQDTGDDIVITRRTRQEIQAQIDTLPPGIQRRLARGRSLPPGIAKKISLPTQVNRYIDLRDDVQIIVVDRDVVVVDPVTDLIVDILRDVLL